MHPTSPGIRDQRIGLAAAIGAAVIYGAAYPATAIALRSFTPLGIAGLACTIALGLVLGLARLGALPQPSLAGMTGPRLGRLAVLACLGGLGFIVGVNVAVALAGPTITGFVATLYAVLATLFAVPVLGERISRVTIGAFAAALIGTVLLAGVEPTGQPAAGVAMAFASAAMFGLYLVLARRWTVPYRLDGTLVTIGNLIGRGPALLVAALVLEGGRLVPAHPDPGALIALASIVVGSSTTGNLLLMASVRRVAAGRTSAALLLTPIASALIAALVFTERLAPIQLAGGALILLGIAGASGVRPGRPPPRPSGAAPRRDRAA
ncbi:MAG: DMT family transporter [Candidatus Limnocylindrales bacterium]|nr:DMT family transporter [Candidatus Limnocylindrales bacterium]